MRALRVTVTVERVDWTDASGQPITTSSVTRMGYRPHGLVDDTPKAPGASGAAARRELHRLVTKTANAASEAANDCDLWTDEESMV